MGRRFVLILIAGLASCDKPSDPSIKESAQLNQRAKLASDLYMMAKGASISTEKAISLGAELKNTATVQDYVDKLVETKMPYGLAKSFFFGGGQGVKNRHPIPAFSNLKTFSSENKTVYRLRTQCETEDIISLRPWWQAEPVWVCADAVKADIRGDDAERTCGASVLSPYRDDTCGCGPRLMWCTPDEEMRERLKASLQGEINRTIKTFVNDDRPVEDLFTSKSTVRNWMAEFVYRRARVAAGEDPSILDFASYDDQTYQEMERQEQVPGHHAGILTAPALIFGSDALRGVMRNYFSYLWCASASGSGVTTQGVLDLEVVDLRIGDGWKQLASMNICTDCHARLDYSMQFFHGYPSSTMGVDFNPERSLVDQQMHFYGDNIGDQRGVEAANPRGFARLALAQPEFGDCLARRVVDHVFHGTHSGDDFYAVRDSFEATHRLKPMLRTALIRYGSQMIDPASAPAQTGASAQSTDANVQSTDEGPSTSDGLISVPTAVRHAIDNRCIECHDEGDPVPLNVDRMSADRMLQMAELVGFKIMPKTAVGMPSAERQAFVRAALAVVISDPKERETAQEYLLNGLAGHPVHRFHTGAAAIALRAGGTRKQVSIQVVESAVPQSRLSYSPTISISSGLMALSHCKNSDVDDLAACVERASSPEAVVVGAL
jgi:hypothetical protein